MKLRESSFKSVPELLPLLALSFEPANLGLSVLVWAIEGPWPSRRAAVGGDLEHDGRLLALGRYQWVLLV